MISLVADQMCTIEVDCVPLTAYTTLEEKNKMTNKITDQKLEAASGLTFIWPQENWMVSCNISISQYFAYSYTLKPIPCVFMNPRQFDMQTNSHYRSTNCHISALSDSEV